MKYLNSMFILLSLFICSTTLANVGDSIVYDNILYKITQHNDLAKVYEVEIAQLPMQEYITTPAIVPYNDNEYKVTSFVSWMLPYCDDCIEKGPDSTLHVTKIDLSESVYIIGDEIEYLMSGGIQIDTLILPPNLICPPDILIYYNESKRWTTDYKRKPCISTLIITNPNSNIHTLGFANLVDIEEIDISVVNVDSLNKPKKAFYSGVFESCRSLKTVKLPEKIRYIGFATFEECRNLINLKLPDSLEYISKYAFANTRLDSIYIPQKVNYISPNFISNSFYLRKIDVNPINQHFKSIDGVLYSKGGDSIHSIPFSLSKDTLFFPENVRSINEFAFGLGIDADGGAVSPSRVYLTYDTLDVIHHFYVNNKLYQLGEYAFYYSPLKSIKNFENTHVISIPKKCFQGCLLDTIKFPIELMSIKHSAFANCKNLEYIEFTRQFVSTIESRAFAGCVSLKKLDLSKQTRLKDISCELCLDDSTLNVLKLPRSIEKIEARAFKNCISLDTIEVPILEPIPITEDVFDGVDKARCKLIVPKMAIEKYRNAPVWKDFFNIEVGKNMFVLEVMCDTTMGSVDGSGVYNLGEKINIYATPNEGYYLNGWSDAPDINQQWRAITLESDTTITAYFTKKQEYYNPIIVKGYNWNIVNRRVQLDGNNITEYSTISEKIEGDSIINNITYKKLWRSTNNEMTEYSIVALVREDVDNRKVWAYIDEKEYLIYDFACNVGDKVTTLKSLQSAENLVEEITMTIKAIEKIEDLDGAKYNKYTATIADQDIVYYERFGSENGWYSRSYDGITGGGVNFMVCAFDSNGELLFKPTHNNELDEIEDCYINETKTNIENITTSNTSLQKVIHNGQLYIIKDGKTYNLMGIEIEGVLEK